MMTPETLDWLDDISYSEIQAAKQALFEVGDECEYCSADLWGTLEHAPEDYNTAQAVLSQYLDAIDVDDPYVTEFRAWLRSAERALEQDTSPPMPRRRWTNSDGHTFQRCQGCGSIVRDDEARDCACPTGVVNSTMK